MAHRAIPMLWIILYLDSRTELHSIKYIAIYSIENSQYFAYEIMSENM